MSEYVKSTLMAMHSLNLILDIHSE